MRGSLKRSTPEVLVLSKLARRPVGYEVGVFYDIARRGFYNGPTYSFNHLRNKLFDNIVFLAKQVVDRRRSYPRFICKLT